MLGEVSLLEVTVDNPNLLNVTPGTVVVLDPATSSASALSVKMPAGANDLPFGVLLDRASKYTDVNTGVITVDKSSGLPARLLGWVFCVAGGTIAVNDRVAIKDATGQVLTIAQTAGGAQPKPIVGIALSAATSGQGVFVMLTPGATW